MKKELLTLPGRAVAATVKGAFRFTRRVLAVIPYVPQMLRRPKLVCLWLARSHVAQLLLVAALLLLPQIAPRFTDAVLERVYSPVSEDVLGVISIKRTNPNLQLRQQQARALLLYGGWAAVGIAFWLSIPAAVRRGGDIAGRKESRADALSDKSPSSALTLYRSALTWTTDEKSAKRLGTKLRKVEKSLGGDGQTNTRKTARRPAKAADGTAIASDRTVVMEPAAGVSPAGRYETVRELGRGNMGVVLLAHDTVLEREVAIKELPHAVIGDVKLFERFRREAKALAKLNHPGIVQVYDFVEMGPTAWIVMEYVAGRELSRALNPKNPMTPAEVAALARPMAEALAYAHERGVLHRDLKPANVMVDGAGQPKIMDFGVARLAASGAHTQPGTVIGSPSYMAPEQALGKTTGAAADVYSLGAVLYALLAGHPPFEGAMQEVIAQVIHQEPESIRKAGAKMSGRGSAKLADLVMSMLAKKTSDRPSSMYEVLEALEAMPFKGS